MIIAHLRRANFCQGKHDDVDAAAVITAAFPSDWFTIFRATFPLGNALDQL